MIFKTKVTIEDCHYLLLDLNSILDWLDWCDANKLRYNLDKRQVMTFTKSKQLLTLAVKILK